MGKVNRETLNVLEGLINCVIIRTMPTESGNSSYTNEPVRLKKIKIFMGRVKLVVANPSEPIDGKAKTITLDPEFADTNWIPYHWRW